VSLLSALEPLQRRRRWVRFVSVLAWLGIALAIALPIGFGTHLLLANDVSFLRFWCAGYLVALVVGVGIALFRGGMRDTTHALAVAVERRWPELGERIITSVSAETEGRVQGDPIWIEAMRQEAGRLLTDKPIREACSWQPASRLLRVSAVVLLIAAVPLCVSSTYARFAHRMLFAWTDQVHGFRVEVSPGDAAVARGENVIVTVKLVPDTDGVKLPEVAQFTIEGKPHVMLRAEADGSFATVQTAKDDETSWRLQVGSRIVGPFRLRAIDPAKLLQSNVTVAAPPYASANFPEISLKDPTTFSALQYSRVEWTFRLDRSARAVRVHHTLGGIQQATPLSCVDGTCVWKTVADRPGHHEAILETEVEEGVKWKTPLASWSVWADQPPVIVEPLNDGSPSSDRVASVGDRLRLKATVEDAVGLESVQLEWRVGQGPVSRMPLHLGPARLRSSVDLLFSLEGKAKEGDRIAFRIRASDGRRLAKGEAGFDLPEQALLPQTTADPPDDEQGERWLEYRVEPKAEPWHKKLIFAKRDEIAQELEAIREKLEKERKDLHAVRPMFHQAGGGLNGEIGRRLDAISALNRDAALRLNRVGMKALGISGLAPLGRLARDVARRELGASEASLAKAAAKDAAAAVREREIDAADAEVRKAIDRLADLRKANDVLAQARLEQEDLERLGLREEILAEKAGDDAMTEEDLAKLAEEQAKLVQDFEKFAGESPQGKALAAKMQQAKAEQLAKQAQELAIRQRKLAEERADAMRKTMQDLAVRFAERQDAIAKKSAASDKEVRKIVPHVAAPIKDAESAAERIREGDFEKALATQKNVEAKLRTLSAALESDVDLAASPREKARRLAEREQQLIDRLERLGEDIAKLKPDQIAQQLRDIAKDQQAVVEATRKLETPESARATAKQAVEQGTNAVEKIGAKQALEAHESMEATRDALKQLAASLPQAAPREAEKETADQKKLRGESANLAAIAKEQRALHDEIVKALAEGAKERGGAGEGLAKDAEKLGKQLMEFAQQADGPEAKKLGQEAAMEADAAQKAAAAGKKDAEAGEVGDAKKAADEAAMRFNMAGKKAEEAAALSAKGAPDANEATQALADSQAKLQSAAAKPDPNRLKAAAKSLQKASKVLGDQTARKYPAPGPDAMVQVPDLPHAFKDLAGRPWGELPGEVRARLIEDLRSRYGEEYGPIIQRYFRNLAERNSANRD
jgi:hypothetical protein